MSTSSPIVVPPVVSKRRYWPERLAILGVSFALYMVACATPALHIVIRGTPENWSGTGILLTGWSGIFVGQMAWYANLFLLAAVLAFLFRLWITTAVVLAVGILIAMQTFLVMGVELPADEGGVTKMHLTSLAIGGYFWFASFVVPLVGTVVMRFVAGKAEFLRD